MSNLNVQSSNATPNPRIGDIPKGSAIRKSATFPPHYGSTDQTRMQQVPPNEVGFNESIFVHSRENSATSNGGRVSPETTNEQESEALLSMRGDLIKDKGEESPEQGVPKRFDSMLLTNPKVDKDGRNFGIQHGSSKRQIYPEQEGGDCKCC